MSHRKASDSRAVRQRHEQLNDLISRIQQDNQYAHVSGDFSEKTALQNRLLEQYGDYVDVEWDGDDLLVIEYRGRSAGHLPINLLTPGARRAVGHRLGLLASD